MIIYIYQILQYITYLQSSLLPPTKRQPSPGLHWENHRRIHLRLSKVLRHLQLCVPSRPQFPRSKSPDTLAILLQPSNRLSGTAMSFTNCIQDLFLRFHCAQTAGDFCCFSPFFSLNTIYLLDLPPSSRMQSPPG